MKKINVQSQPCCKHVASTLQAILVRSQWTQSWKMSREFRMSFMQLRATIGARPIGYLNFIWQLICQECGVGTARAKTFPFRVFSTTILARKTVLRSQSPDAVTFVALITPDRRLKRKMVGNRNQISIFHPRGVTAHEGRPKLIKFTRRARIS